MSEGLKLLVTADLTQAEKSLKDFVGTAATSGKAAGSALGKGLNTAVPAISNIPKAVAPAIKSVSKLGDTLETLRAKLGARQSFLNTEKDVVKVASLNLEIKALEKEIVRVQSIGSEGIGLGGVGKVANEGFSLLRKAAFILPGIGVAGILGGAADAVTSLFTASDKTNDKFKELFVSINAIGADAGASTAGESAKVQALAGIVLNLNNSYKDRNRAITELRGINKNYFGDLTLEASSLAILKARVDEYTSALINQAIVKKFSDQIADTAIALSKQGQELAAASGNVAKFKSLLSKPVKINVATGLPVFDPKNTLALQDANKSLTEQSGIFNTLIDQQRKLRAALGLAVEEGLKFRPLDDKGETKQAVDKTIEQAKRLAAFLDKNTQFSVKFEVDPTVSEAENIKSAHEFIDKSKEFFENQTSKLGVFDFKPLVRMDFQFNINPEVFRNISQQAEVLGTRTFAQVKTAFKESADQALTGNTFADTITKQINAALRLQEKQQQEIAVGIGIKLPDGVLTDIQKQSVAAANTINGVLQPAFQDLFSAIKAGQNPLEAFFQGIGQAVEQLIQKLIAAAVEALILSAIFPGGVGTVKGFGGFFKNILGFASGGIVSGPQLALIGEGVGTSRSNPEVVAPLDQLRSMLGDLGGGGQVVVLRTSVRGNNLQLIQDRNTSRNRRAGR